MTDGAARDVRVLVVDDEAPARQRLIDALYDHPRVAELSEAEGGLAAVRSIFAERIDIVFLDVQMPGCSGLEVVERVGASRMPLTIFVTAYDQHALRAFEANALDYLLKPYSDERLDAALARAIERKDEMRMGAFGESIRRMLGGAAAPEPFLDRFAIKTRATTIFVLAEDVDWIEADGVYVVLHSAEKKRLYRASLTELANRLDPKRFVRIHRSAIVNIDAIVRLESISHGEFEIVFRNGSTTRVSRTYRSALERRLGQSL